MDVRGHSGSAWSRGDRHGGNTGIGFQTARMLAQRGARIIGRARDQTVASKLFDVSERLTNVSFAVH